MKLEPLVTTFGDNVGKAIIFPLPTWHSCKRTYTIKEVNGELLSPVSDSHDNLNPR